MKPETEVALKQSLGFGGFSSNIDLPGFVRTNLLQEVLHLMEVQTAAAYATILGFAATIVGLIYAGIQIRSTSQIAEGQFLLELTKMFAVHDEVHKKLRPGGIWANGKANPSTPEDWTAVDNYMGLFERCEILMRQRSLRPEHFSSLFAYRVDNILSQGAIVGKKLEGGEKKYWADFVLLIKRLNRMKKLNSDLPI